MPDPKERYASNNADDMAVREPTEEEKKLIEKALIQDEREEAAENATN